MKRSAPLGVRLAVMAAVAAIIVGVASWLLGAPWYFAAGIPAVTAASVWGMACRDVLRQLRALAERSAQMAAGESTEPVQCADPLAQIGRDLDAVANALQTRDALLRTAEEALRTNEARYRNLFDSNPHPMLVFDVETLEILAANDAAIRRYGFTRQQFLRMTVRHLLPEAVTGGVPAVLERMALHHEHPREDIHRCRDGRLIDVEVSSHRIQFANRPAAIAMLADITLRKRAEAENQRRAAAMAHLYESALEQSATLSTSEVAEAVVRAAVERFGAGAAWLQHRSENASRGIIAAWPRASGTVPVGHSDADPVKLPSAIALRDRRPVCYPTDEALWESGPWADNEAPEGLRHGIAFPLAARDRAFGVLHMLSDKDWVADQQRLDVLSSFALNAGSALINAEMHEQLEEVARWLEHRVQERTAELEFANKELQSFAHSVSHDLRAPLRGIQGFTRLLLHECAAELSEGARHYLGMILCNVDEMQALITALLAFSRSARQPLHLHEVDTNSLVETVLTSLQHEMEGRNIEFRIGVLPPCMADRTLLRQVFANLLSNAIKYTARSNPAVIEVGSMAAENEQVYYVRDNGVGFDPTNANRLFGVFQRLHSSDEFPGTGVGLATVQRIVTRHGGRIWFDAAPGRGATFYFTIASQKSD